MCVASAYLQLHTGTLNLPSNSDLLSKQPGFCMTHESGRPGSKVTWNESRWHCFRFLSGKNTFFHLYRCKASVPLGDLHPAAGTRGRVAPQNTFLQLYAKARRHELRLKVKPANASDWFRMIIRVLEAEDVAVKQETSCRC